MSVALVEFHRDALGRASSALSNRAQRPLVVGSRSTDVVLLWRCQTVPDRITATLSNRDQSPFGVRGRLTVVVVSPTAVQHLPEARISFTQGGQARVAPSKLPADLILVRLDRNGRRLPALRLRVAPTAPTSVGRHAHYASRLLIAVRRLWRSSASIIVG